MHLFTAAFHILPISIYLIDLLPLSDSLSYALLRLPMFLFFDVSARLGRIGHAFMYMREPMRA